MRGQSPQASSAPSTTSATSDRRLILVLGGAGIAGETVVHALLNRGATVVVPSRSDENLHRLLGGIDESPAGLGGHRDRLHTLIGDIGTPGGAAAVRDTIAEEIGEVDAIVASLGGWWEGEYLVDLPSATWERILRDNLTSHFLAARTFLPILADREDPVYVMLAGIAAELPVPASGPISVTGAAQRMLMQTLAMEPIAKQVRLHEVAVLTPIVTRHWGDTTPESGWLSGQQVGEYVADVLEPTFPQREELLLRVPNGP